MRFKISVLISIVLIILTAVSIIYIWWRIRAPTSSLENPPPFTSAALVAHLQECSDLVTVRAPITTVMEQHESGRVGGAKALLAVTAWLDVGCDLKSATVLKADSHAHQVHLSLPAPKVLAVRLDSERTRVYDLQRSGLWHLIPGSSIEQRLVNQAVQSATTANLIDQPTTESLVQLARERIRAELQVLATGCGWNVEVTWQP